MKAKDFTFKRRHPVFFFLLLKTLQLNYKHYKPSYFLQESAAIPQSVLRLATVWTVRGSNLPIAVDKPSRIRGRSHNGVEGSKPAGKEWMFVVFCN